MGHQLMVWEGEHPVDDEEAASTRVLLGMTPR